MLRVCTVLVTVTGTRKTVGITDGIIRACPPRKLPAAADCPCKQANNAVVAKALTRQTNESRFVVVTVSAPW